MNSVGLKLFCKSIFYFDGTEFLLSGGKYGIGSDSNVRISLTEELRLLEYSQRLVRKERNVMTSKTGSVGRALYDDSLAGGAQALGRKSGSIVPGNWADLLTLCLLYTSPSPRDRG